MVDINIINNVISGFDSLPGYFFLTGASFWNGLYVCKRPFDGKKDSA